MQVINKQSSRSGIVVGETAKSYKIRAISNSTTWLSKQYAVIDFDFYQAQLAMHLWAGYQSTSTDALDTIDIIDGVSAYIPALVLASRKLDAQLQAGRDDWSNVFCYDVAQTAGAWLAENPKATVADFSAHLEELIA